MSADLIETPPDIDQIATRIAGNYLDAPISCAKLYREVVAALMAERAAKDTALSNLELVTSGLNKQLTEQFELSTKYIALATAAEAALSGMRAELDRLQRRIAEVDGAPSPREGQAIMSEAAAIARAEAAETQLERARKALEPFAEASRRFDAAARGFEVEPRPDSYVPHTDFTHGELRAAARAASQDEGEERT